MFLLRTPQFSLVGTSVLSPWGCEISAPPGVAVRDWMCMRSKPEQQRQPRDSCWMKSFPSRLLKEEVTVQICWNYHTEKTDLQVWPIRKEAELKNRGKMVRWASQMAQWVKNLPVMRETQEIWVPSLGWEDPLEQEMATHSNILAWKIPWTEEPGLHSKGPQRIRHDWVTKQVRQDRHPGYICDWSLISFAVLLDLTVLWASKSLFMIKWYDYD